jgi:hypothetical protein|nr:MAG TPA: hypothetical protein [Caudoviricetes sp.]
MYSNAEKLATVVAYWARPAISQVATTKLLQLPVMQSAQASLMASGMVGSGYSLASDIQPFVEPIINSLVTPMLNRYFEGIPDEAIPKTARAIVDKMKQQRTFSILDGLITFEEADILELDALLSKNLPVETDTNYQLVK